MCADYCLFECLHHSSNRVVSARSPVGTSVKVNAMIFDNFSCPTLNFVKLLFRHYTEPSPAGGHNIPAQTAFRVNITGLEFMLVSLPVSIGEAIDKLTILQIKSERINASDKLVNVNKELGILKSELDKIDRLWERVADPLARLKTVNEELWVIEDEIRVKEFRKEFDEEFIRLARAVYVTNDKRAEVKKEINMLLGSELIEEKSYEDYV